MAAAFFNQLADPARARATSAGTDPATRVHPEVVAAMREVGIDLAGASTRVLSPELMQEAELVVTMGCGEACPAVLGPRRGDWEVPDPKGQSAERVREIRDEVRARVGRLVAEEGWGRTTP
jgi:arsenate reductase